MDTFQGTQHIILKGRATSNQVQLVHKIIKSSASKCNFKLMDQTKQFRLEGKGLGGWVGNKLQTGLG